ncbi:glutathione-specific gamma-glutamylcyclotransferase 1-like [Saccostrea echinata]|uniref:glutathione-specific gamma-glutamylcyclotransferase 1-like n=1 Tax=Saccostrea echinata TaxID=191078 RepID=UPI002A81964A|nr:glutathione-specific gamma-glutamylcyclotransferase 1-like [Saccostrea echinata]
MFNNNEETSDEVFEFFGYGSLLWKHDFKFSQKGLGFIKGVQRKFWQENKTHRGTEEKPGRVAILHETKEDDILWGVKFTIVGSSNIQEVKEKLNVRETVLGGYTSFYTTFYNEEGVHSKVLVFNATKDNDLYVGPMSDDPHDDVEHIAKQVVAARGKAGTNAEYVIKLAYFVRHYFPKENDQHLFLLDKKVQERLGNHSESVVTYFQQMENNTYHV